MNYIELHWGEYKAFCLPVDLPPAQFLEAKLAFYAGATAIFGVLMNSAQNPQTTQDEGEALLGDIEQEIEQFGKLGARQAIEDHINKEVANAR